jgi:hypothetical protein
VRERRKASICALGVLAPPRFGGRGSTAVVTLAVTAGTHANGLKKIGSAKAAKRDAS